MFLRQQTIPLTFAIQAAPCTGGLVEAVTPKVDVAIGGTWGYWRRVEEGSSQEKISAHWRVIGIIYFMQKLISQDTIEIHFNINQCEYTDVCVLGGGVVGYCLPDVSYITDQVLTLKQTLS